ncbi:MAG: family 10 glycosylhydrolase [Nostocaceae cyanobacterium]|nr:family 10 glycosylhydrolase [Nostocaceae cyanobacterium]
MVFREKFLCSGKLNIKKAGFIICKFPFLLFNFLHVAPATASVSQTVISVVYSQENATQWTGISNRLQASGVKYCVISLDSVRTMADWGERPILFLPNVEMLSPAQVIALEEWMSKGGRLIASGPVGSLSAPGVRQLLRSMLGGYWGFSLNTPQKLEPSKNKFQSWANQKDLFGQVRGGVVIANNLRTQAAAVWNSPDNPAAVVATDNTTFFGWRWGVDTAAKPELDTAWLQASLNRYVKTPYFVDKKVAGGSQSCSANVVAKASSNLEAQGNRKIEPTGQIRKTSPSIPQKTATAPISRPVVPKFASPVPQEDIDRLETQVDVDITPTSRKPINRREAIALQQELENLIGRVESAHLAAAANGETLTASANNPQGKAQQAQVASVKGGVSTVTREQAIARARSIAQNLPRLISQRKYAQARQQWLAAKSALWQQFPLDRRLAQPEIRAMWLDRGTIVRARNEQGLAKIFDRMAQAGINTVFLETVNSSYTIYPSQVAPQQNPLTKGWDPLAAGVKLAHERGMELHAWVWTFAAGNRRHNKILNIKANYPGPVLAANPDWAGYDNRGRMIPSGQTKPFFDPANPQVRDYLLRLYTEIVTKYKVDGLQLDYIRYPFQDPARGRSYGYGKAARERFQQLTGVDPQKISPRQRNIWQKWTEFRTQQVDSFVAEVSQKLRSQRPNLILSAAVFPLPERERIHKLQQNWEAWAQRGDIDLIVPMTYAQDTLRFQRLAQPWISTRKLGSSLLIPGIRLLQLPTLGALDQIQLVRDLPTSGYALFAAENLHNDLHKVFSNTQGKVPGTKEPIAYRQPFKTAAMRYVALKREWQVVLEQDQLKIPKTMRSVFNSQTKVLQRAFDKLAADPNSSNLLVAKSSLARFQSQFRVWTRQHAVENAYQINVWENRLAAIERLLLYGEKMKK